MVHIASLPQPQIHDGEKIYSPYKYVTYEELEIDWLGDPNRLLRSWCTSKDRDMSASAAEDNARYKTGTLVWVLLSKGRQHSKNNCHSACNSLMLHKKRRDKKNTRAIDKLPISDHNGINASQTKSLEKDENKILPSKECNFLDYKKNVTVDKKDSPQQSKKNIASLSYHSKSEMFLRARVVSDHESLKDTLSLQERMERRVLVRYSKGATYHVRAYNIIPLLDPSYFDVNTTSADEPTQSDHTFMQPLPPMVILTPETHIYRRITKQHTNSNDSFMEIGCDYGITVDKIRRSMEEAGNVPIAWPPDVDGTEDSDPIVDESFKHQTVDRIVNTQVACLGVDKSKESIDIANERYPLCKFALANVLIPEDMSYIRTLCERTLKKGAPSIISLDVNGNREIDGVLQCLQMVMNEKWVRQPRLIIVKSRFLYWDLKEMM